MYIDKVNNVTIRETDGVSKNVNKCVMQATMVERTTSGETK